MEHIGPQKGKEYLSYVRVGKMSGGFDRQDELSTKIPEPPPTCPSVVISGILAHGNLLHGDLTLRLCRWIRDVPGFAAGSSVFWVR